MTRRRLLASTAAFAGLIAIAPLVNATIAGPIEVSGVWARASGSAQETTAYLTVINHGTEPDGLLDISSSRAQHAELRRRVWKGLVTKLEKQPHLAIPPMARTVIAPGGVEIYVTGLVAAVHEGDELPLTLTFANAGSVDVTATVSRRFLGPQ